MKGTDLILLTPAIACAGGLTGLMQYAAHPGDLAFLMTAILLFVIGAGTFAGLFLLVRNMHRNPKD